MTRKPMFVLVESDTHFFGICDMCDGWGEHNPYGEPVDCQNCNGTGESWRDMSCIGTLVHNIAIAGALSAAWQSGHNSARDLIDL